MMRPSESRPGTRSNDCQAHLPGDRLLLRPRIGRWLTAPRTSNRLDPVVSWTVLSDAPLLGLSYAREAGLLLAWDDASKVYLLDADGDRRYESRAPERILSAAISDDGSLVALLVGRSKLLFLGPELEPLQEKTAPPEAATLAVDPHGRFVAVGTKTTETVIFTRHGRTAAKVETRQPLGHIRFVPGLPMLLGASTFGLLTGIELAEVRLSAGLDAEILWEEKLGATIGNLECSGDGAIILASCFTHGVQRYDLRGQNEGSYHVGGTVSHAVPDFAGRSIAVATTEGELALLNLAGNVRWKTALARGPVALQIDPLGRALHYGLPTGEITRIDLDARAKRPPAASTRPAPTRPRPASIRSPDWSELVSQTEDQAETAVLGILDDPPRVAVYSNSNRMQVFSAEGELLTQSPDCSGVGRILRTAPGWIAAATDRNLVLFDARRSEMQRLDLNLVNLTHLVLRPETFGLAIVQERDRLGRASPSGRWMWRRELRSPVEDLAVTVGNLVAVSTDSGRLEVYDAAGEPVGHYATDPPEALLLVEAPEGGPAGVAWVTLARRNQVLRGHTMDGRVVWETPIPWESWQLLRVGGRVVATAPDGRAMAFDGSGHPRGECRADHPVGEFFEGDDGDVLRVSRQGVHLICDDLGGRVRWRAVSEAGIGPIAASSGGTAAILGRDLAWFASIKR